MKRGEPRRRDQHYPRQLNPSLHPLHPYGRHQKLGDECHGAGPLDDRVRRLVKVGIAAAAQSEGAVHSAVRHAKAAGISAAEIHHVIVLSITTIGFPRAMAAMSWADDILRK